MGFHLLNPLVNQAHYSFEVPIYKVSLEFHLRLPSCHLTGIDVGLFKVGEKQFDWGAGVAIG